VYYLNGPEVKEIVKMLLSKFSSLSQREKVLTPNTGTSNLNWVIPKLNIDSILTSKTVTSNLTSNDITYTKGGT
jgi:hypothetical protein